MELTDRRRLPDEVRARLEQAPPSVRDQFAVVQRGRLFEARTSVRWELRASKDDLEQALAARSGDVPIVGYATTYEQPYPVAGGAASGFGWDEVMATGSWARTISLADDVRLLLNHDGLPLARTSAKTMKLASDDVGVLVDATLDMRSGYARDVAAAIERGDLSQMSCAFEVTKQDWSPDYMQRRILEVKGFDVSVVGFPANEATMVMVPGNQASAAAADPAEPTGNVCPNCDHQVPAGVDPCPNCGADMGYESDSRAARGMSLSYARALADQLRFRRAS